MTAKTAPLWRRVVEQVDGAVTPAVNALMRSDELAALVTEVTRLRRAVEKKVDGASRRALHALNLPAATDVHRLLVQIGALQHELRTFHAAAHAGDDPADHAPRRTRTRPSGGG